MIFFKTIRYKNFLSTGNLFTEIDLATHKQTLIVGANGAGKSTILDALMYVLYNKPYRNINKPQLINSINQKNLVVELEFFAGSDKYLIRRGMKPNVFEIVKNGNLVNQSADARDYQEHLEKNILKLNFKSFSQIVVLGSASYVPFMQLPAAHRRAVIEDLLDIQVFSTMNNILKIRASDNKSNLSDIDFKINLVREKIKLQEQHVQKLTADKNSLIENAKNEIVKCEHNIVENTTKANELRASIASLNETISDTQKVSARIQFMNKVEAQLNDKLNRLKKELSFFHDNDSCPTCKQEIDTNFKCTAVDTRKSNMQEVEEGVQKLREEYVKTTQRQAEIQKTLENISTLERQVSSINSDITMLNNLITRYTKEITLYEEQRAADLVVESTDEFKKELKEYEKEKNIASDYKQVLDIVANLLKDTGIKAKIIKQYIPIMNKLINKYLAAMDFFVNFELNENFEEKIKSRYRDEFSFESFSEGEKMRLNLAVLFAWRAIAKLRNSANVNILIFDETLDGSLDNSGIEDFLKIIYGLISDTNTIIISHKAETIDKFSNVIRFEKHKNFSRIQS
jgi:DNA repair exonuclease SbcCD ATPase subunit